MIKLYPSEKFKEFILNKKAKNRYAVSNYGRIISFTDKKENGVLLKGGLVDGYRMFGYTKYLKKQAMHGSMPVHRLVAENFIPNRNEKRVHVIHLDYVRDNNAVENLKWATPEERIEHHKKSPHVIKARKALIKFNIERDGHKLKTTDVIKIKTMLFNPKRKTPLREIAKKYGISEMQLFRIQRGEIWGHIKIDGISTKKQLLAKEKKKA